MGFKLWVFRLLRNFQCKLHIEAFIQHSSVGRDKIWELLA